MTDAKGRYTFPRTHVAPGKYTVAIRAVGYDLAGPSAVDVTAKTAKLDLKLEPTKDLLSQLTSMDLLTLFPLTPADKDKLAHQPMSCNYCHNYRRIVRSKHDVAGLVRAQERMKTVLRRWDCVERRRPRAHRALDEVRRLDRKADTDCADAGWDRH